MKSKFLATWLMLAGAGAFAQGPAPTQTPPPAEAGVTYEWVHSNAPYAQCGCFHWQGGSAFGSFGFAPHWSAAAVVSGEHATRQGDTTLLQPTMITYVFGLRYTPMSRTHRIAPFAQLLAGGAYATNGYFVTDYSEKALAMRLGGGIDIALTRHWGVRAINADYLWTHFKNGQADRQNNLSLSVGVLYRFHGR